MVDNKKHEFVYQLEFMNTATCID